MAKPPPPASSPFWTLFNAFGRLQVRLMHLTRGRFGGKLMGGPGACPAQSRAQEWAGA